MNNPLGTESQQRDLQAIGVATGLGITVVVSLLLCIGAGVLLDRWLGTSPILVLVGVALGLAASGYALYELAVLGIPDRGHIRLRRSNADARAENAVRLQDDSERGDTDS